MACESSDSDLEGLPPLFNDEVPKLSMVPRPKTLERRDGWSVVEEETADGGALRWMVSDAALSLDQTRVQLTAPDLKGERHFCRDSLRAASHQVMVLALGLALDSTSECLRHSLCVLGGGGMALPMVLVTQVQSVWVHVVELHDVVIDFAVRYFGASHERLLVEQGDAISIVQGPTRPWLPKSLAGLVVDIDFLRGTAPPEFLSLDFWKALWATMKPDAIVAVNTIGAEAADVQALAQLARMAVTVETFGATAIGALVLEPGPGDRRVWTALIPRPSVLLLAPPLLLSKIAGAARNPEGFERQLPSWVGRVAADVLRAMAQGKLQASWLEPTAELSKITRLHRCRIESRVE
ncbi:unnamed protein product, partial [Symbiodinium sp. CCMP2592]